MPLINNPVRCSTEHTQLIIEKTNDPTFRHSDWGLEELQQLRSYIREHYRREQMGTCAYCKNPLSLSTASNAHVEHIAPKSLYFNFIFEPKNLCVICADCNTIKRDQETFSTPPNTVKPLQENRQRKTYPRSSSAFLIVHPHFDNWEDHIQKFGIRYTDITDKGAFTINACRLNRFFHKNLNIPEELVSDDDLIRNMKAFIESDSAVARTRILEQLARIISPMNL
jgi:5-methylcytosine-specific restriction endonuclease McrA